MKNDTRLSDTEFREATQYIEDARTLIDFLEQHPFLIKDLWSGLTVSVYTSDKNDLAELTRELGTADKISSEYYFTTKKKFGKHGVEISCSREKVCTKKKTGTKIIKKRDPEAVSAALANIPEIEVEEDIFEWDCPGSILKED